MNPTQAAESLNASRSDIVFPRPDINPLEILEAIKITDFVSNATGRYTVRFDSGWNQASGMGRMGTSLTLTELA